MTEAPLDAIPRRAQHLLEMCQTKGLRIATAESCTGGMIAAALTDIAGSSAVVDRGFVTYSNAAKADMLLVPPDLIAAKGAVSADVAQAMAEGALAASPADLAISVTGIAGPGGGSASKPVGLVHFCAVSRAGRIIPDRAVFPGDRAAVRHASVLRALALLQDLAMAD